MHAYSSPSPFPAPAGFDVEVVGGLPPYTYSAAPSPPNPPGVVVAADGHVTVPPGTPPGTDVYVDVTDSSVPSQTARAANRTA